MKKYVARILFTLATLFSTCCTQGSSHYPELENLTVPERLQHETVALVQWIGVVGFDSDGDPILSEVDPAEDKDAKLSAYCSAVWVAQDVILTADHCVKDLGKPPVDLSLQTLMMLMKVPDKEWDPTGQPLIYSTFGDVQDTNEKTVRETHAAKVLAVDVNNDLALIKTDTVLPYHPTVTVADEVHVGEPVHVMGHPMSYWWTYSHGWVAQIHPHITSSAGHWVSVLQISAPIWFGNSGGGVFNEDGQLLGIVSFLTTRAPNVAYVIDYKTIAKFLQENHIKQ